MMGMLGFEPRSDGLACCSSSAHSASSLQHLEPTILARMYLSNIYVEAVYTTSPNDNLKVKKHRRFKNLL